MTSTASAFALALSNQSTLAAPTGLAAKVTGAALAAWATPGPLAAATVGLMGSAKTTTAIATLVALSAIGFGLAQRAQSQAATRELANLRREHAALAVQFAHVERRTPTQEATAPVADQKIPPPIPTSGTATAPAAPTSPAPSTATFEATKDALASISMAGGQLRLDRGHIANVRTWVEQDPAGLVSWIASATQPSTRQREHTTEAVVAIATETNPDFAFQLTSGFERDSIRTSRRLHVVRAWASRDPVAAARAVAAANLPQSDRERLLQIIEVMGPREAGR